ncbi:MAG TPA: non-ribosomal peptide synthetase [Pyrinomonadaceae bacterium]|nr:non-ribosomal peptide synthetase [Pyrinomonadaceae bacterium]
MSASFISSSLPEDYSNKPLALHSTATWGARHRANLTDPCVSDLVAAQAAATPEAPAVSTGSTTLTYRELDQQANQLAHRLMALGLERESIVGICMNRSPEAIVCALAVLKAGGAYLPLDPSYPIERLSFMLNEAQPRVLIARKTLPNQLAGSSWKVIYIDSGRTEFENEPVTPTGVEISADQLAYVIYTSGSTGQPKGVEITHKSLLNLVLWHRGEFEVTSSDRASHLASVGFDAAVWEVWPYLTAGASLHLPEDETRISPELLRDWLINEGISISFLPTALAEHVMTLKWPEQSALRFLLTGADTLHRYPTSGLPFQLVNNYGPTECTVVATSGRVRPGVGANTLPAIGRPIANTIVYILDDNLQQVAHGTSGELYIGGAGVARGYLNRPDITAERFIRDPFSPEPQARLYKTGDLACQLPDGEFAYLGRIDDQIKILGHRIEPNEIVAVLDRHPSINLSVVVACGSSCEEKRLAAYVVMRKGATPAAADLRTFLRNELPEYMVPSIFVCLEALPLTPNGKVDRAALPDPDTENTLRDEPFIAARTPIEERLAKILTTLMNLSEVSVNDNFFLLGGHSLLGTQLIAKIRGAFGVELGLRTLFDTPTIADLSTEIERLILARVERMTEDEAVRLLA